MDFQKLTQDAKVARVKAEAASVAIEDGGTCNLDAAFFPLKRYESGTKLVDALRAAGLSAGVSRWLGRGVMVSPPGYGQADKRATANKTFIDHMRSCGYNVIGYYQMD
ncbi:hypothetical protein [Bordetella genomosp. 9]|uniref:Uncharacterized protein n=1 Tax=Bordetella genomosp. 9 TaxID=1416803 RepID=A0A1W6YYU6_9BORD|nr:hypothetical protein [Bordetella genomosp. 9]ARP86272.1 hypothetical protein CAL13_08720 [Bordetella genomosp. 9]